MSNIVVHYPFYRQSNDYSCGPACLKMVFKKHQIQRKEITLARHAKTEREWGTQHNGMIATAQKYGFYGFIKRNGTINDLREFVQKGYGVIIDWTEPQDREGHYSLLIGFTKKEIIYHDPYWGREMRMPIRKFIHHWHEDGSDDFGWMMVLGKNPIPTHLKGRHFHPRK
jgi:ABC-type bacteriocin/lantibiotic exporter with double-glycine peptidase domain